MNYFLIKSSISNKIKIYIMGSKTKEEGEFLYEVYRFEKFF